MQSCGSGGLTAAIARGNFSAFKDGENLMALWSTFIAPPDFDPKPFENTEMGRDLNRLLFEINHYHRNK